mgnify:CR=1 FL=1
MTYQITIDAAGRLVIPKPVRKQLKLSAGTPLQLDVEDDTIVLRHPTTPGALALDEGVLVLSGTLGEPYDFESMREDRIRSLLS